MDREDEPEPPEPTAADYLHALRPAPVIASPFEAGPACPWCDGTGTIRVTGIVCRTCGGSGLGKARWTMSFEKGPDR